MRSDDETTAWEMMTHIAVGVLVFDFEGRLLFANEEAGRLLREAPSDLMKRTVNAETSVVDQHGVPLAFEALPIVRALRKGETVRSFVLGFDLSNSGERVWVSCGTTILGKSQERRRVVCTMTEVSEVQRALGESGALYDSVLRAMSEGVTILNPDGSLRYANPAAERILGLTSDEIRSAGEAAWNVVSESGQRLEPDRLPHELTRKSGEALRDVRIGVLREGELRWLSVTTDPVALTSKGRGVVATFVDVTEEHGAHNSARDARAQLERILAAIPGVVFQYHIDKEGKETYPFISGRVLETLGSNPEQSGVGPRRGWLSVVEEDRDELMRVSGQAIRSLSKYTVDFRYYGANETVRWGRVVAIPERAPEGILTTGVLFDVSDYRRLEDALEIARRREAMGDLAAGVAHNFNNMLAVILPNIELALPTVSGESRLFLEDALLAASGAADLVRQMLKLGRGDSQRGTKRLDFSTIVKDALRISRATFDRAIAFDIEIEAGEYPVDSEAGNLDQVVLNLLLNARDALRGRPSPKIVIRLERRESSCVLSVADNGQGMSSETKARIGEPFFTTKPSGAGTGLGLASTFRTVRECGGTWTIESSEGNGTKFFVELPIARTDGAKKSETVFESRGGGAGLVLLVDDERMVRRVIARQLQRGGYTPLEAENGHEALQVLESLGDSENEVVAAVIDLAMPVMDGRELLGELERRGIRFPIVVLSGHVESPHGLAFAKRVLEKPILGERLLAALAEVVSV